MNDDTLGYIPNLSARISAMNSIATYSLGDHVSKVVDFLPCTASRFQEAFRAAYVNASWFRINFDFYTFFGVGSDRYSYLGMSIGASNWQSYFAGNISVIDLASHGQVIRNASFYLDAVNRGDYGSGWMSFFPIYTLLDGTRSALLNDYEPIDI